MGGGERRERRTKIAWCCTCHDLNMFQRNELHNIDEHQKHKGGTGTTGGATVRAKARQTAPRIRWSVPCVGCGKHVLDHIIKFVHSQIESRLSGRCGGPTPGVHHEPLNKFTARLQRARSEHLVHRQVVGEATGCKRRTVCFRIDLLARACQTW